MFKKLYENRVVIWSNLLGLLNEYKFLLVSLAVLIGLLVLYSYMKITEYNRRFKPYLDVDMEALQQQSNIDQPEIIESFTDSVDNTELATDSVDNTELATDSVDNTDLAVKYLQPGTPPYTDLIAYVDREYLPKLNAVNIQARGNATFPQIRAQYTGGQSGLCEQVTEDDQTQVHALLSGIVKGLQSEKQTQKQKMLDYLRKWLSRSWIAKGRPWLESGMPHTHGPAIIMSHDWLAAPTAGTLIHELMHIHQRKAPQDFDRLYAKWGFRHMDGMISGLESKYPLYRLNPDGLDPNWIWTDPSTGKSYWIASLFTSVDPDSLKDTQYLAFPLQGDSLIYTGSTPIPLSRFQEFQTMFGIANNNYHPNEIAAEYADRLLTDLLTAGGQSTSTSPAYRDFVAWWMSLN